MEELKALIKTKIRLLAEAQQRNKQDLFTMGHLSGQMSLATDILERIETLIVSDVEP